MSSPQRLYDPWAPGDPGTPRVQIVVPMFREARAVRLIQPGRVRTLQAQWPASCAGVATSMNVDLSTDLNALLPQTGPTQAALIHPEGTEQ